MRSLSLQRILVIAQVGMHDLDYAHLDMQAGQIDALFNLSHAFRSQGIIMHTLWMRHHGSGAVKPLGMPENDRCDLRSRELSGDQLDFT